MLDRLRRRNGQSLTELGDGLGIVRQSVTKHLAVLEAAGLVVSEKRGRQRLHFLNAAPIDDIADRWIGRYHRRRANALGTLTRALEATMSETEFVYVTYIRTTPEALWEALTDPEFTARYWGAKLHSDWTEGAELLWEEFGDEPRDLGQRVLVADKPNVLSYSWQQLQPQHRQYLDLTDEQFEQARNERRSKVTFTITAAEDENGAVPGVVKLSVVHDDFEPGSPMLDGISGGWPAILASLKSMLETGDPLSQANDASPKRPAQD